MGKSELNVYCVRKIQIFLYFVVLSYLERSVPGKERSRRMVIGRCAVKPSAWSSPGSWHNGTVLSFLVVSFGLTQIIHFPRGLIIYSL